MKWYKSKSTEEHGQSLRNLQEGAEGRSDLTMNICELLKYTESPDFRNSADRRLWVKVYGLVSLYKPSAEAVEVRPIFYMACKECKKKVTDQDQGYHCLKCNRFYSEANPTYNFSFNL